MSKSDHPFHGRTATLVVLAVLVLTVCATVYKVLSQRNGGLLPAGESGTTAPADPGEIQRVVTLLTILLVSALLILLFVVGAYLLIRAGRLVARDRVGGTPTPYVDAWQNYRLTDEQIDAATGGGRSDDRRGEPPADPDEPPPDPRPGNPRYEE